MYNNKRTCIHVILITTTANKCFPEKWELDVHVDIYVEHAHVFKYTSIWYLFANCLTK